MTLQASGQITSQDIADELAETGEHDMTAFAALAVGDATITAEPHDFTDWYGYTHTFPPSAPATVSNTKNGTQIDLVWTEGVVDATHSNEDLYRLQESVNTGSGFPAFTNVGTSAQDTTTKTYNTFGLPGDLVRTRIRSENAAGESSWVNFPSTVAM